MTFSWTTIASTLAGISAVVLGVMTEVLGCKAGTTDLSAVCSAAWLPTNIAGYAALGFGILMLIGRIISPGGVAANSFGTKAVVLPENDPKSGVGTTTPEEVART
jgi:hypothetical protein